MINRRVTNCRATQTSCDKLSRDKMSVHRGNGSFGISCSIGPENTLAVGDHIYKNRGAVFVYKLNYLSGEQSVQLFNILQPNDLLVEGFGLEVATTAKYIAAGIRSGIHKGVVYLFDKNTNHVCKVEPQDKDTETSFAINDVRLYIGERNTKIFIYTVNACNRLVGLVNRFGFTLAVSGNFMVACDIFYAESLGKCYLYMLNEGGRMQEIATLRPSDGIEGDYFGRSLAIDDRTVIIGSYGKSQGYDAGAIYLYDIENFMKKPTTTTTPTTTVLPSTYIVIISLVSIFIVAILSTFFMRHRRVRRSANSQRIPTQQNEMEAQNTVLMNDVPVHAETPLQEGE